MATLKEHQAAMVDLLANGSGIPASASRLAHAMHDVLSLMQKQIEMRAAFPVQLWPILDRADATTPGLNDKALSKREKALKTDSPAKWPTPAEQRVKELENTIKQLKANNAKLKQDLVEQKAISETHAAWVRKLEIPEQAGCRKPDTQVCDHEFRVIDGSCWKCGVACVDVCHQDKYK